MENKVKDITIFYDNYGNYYISKIDAMDIGAYNRTDDRKGSLRITKEQVKQLKENPSLKIIGNYVKQAKKPLYMYYNEENAVYISTADAKNLDLPNINEELVYYKLSVPQYNELSENKSLQLDRELRLEHEKELWFYDKYGAVVLYTLKEPNWSQEQVQKSNQEKISREIPFFDMRLFLPEKLIEEFGVMDIDSWPEKRQIEIQEKLKEYYIDKILGKNNQRAETTEENNIAMGR